MNTVRLKNLGDKKTMYDYKLHANISLYTQHTSHRIHYF